jgi:hypothetical protein
MVWTLRGAADATGLPPRIEKLLHINIVQAQLNNSSTEQLKSNKRKPQQHKAMADDELAQIRAARLAQLKQQGGSAESGDGQASEQDQKRFVDCAFIGQSLIRSKAARIGSTNEYPRANPRACGCRSTGQNKDGQRVTRQ